MTKKPRCGDIHPLLFVECQKAGDHEGKPHYFATMWDDLADTLSGLRETMAERGTPLSPELPDADLQLIAGLDRMVVNAATIGVRRRAVI